MNTKDEFSKYDRNCGCCGKRFYITHSINAYLYKTTAREGFTYYCKYSCYRAAKEKIGAKRANLDTADKRLKRGKQTV